MKNVNFYKLQMKVGSAGKTISEDMLSNSIITASVDFAGESFESLGSNDIILVHKGSIPIALVSILYRVDENELCEESLGIDYKINILSRYSDLNTIDEKSIGLYQMLGPSGTFNPIYPGNETYNKVKKWYNLIMKKIEKEKAIELLNYKKQIILQGPPGTGKTRMAKLIADEMIKSEKKLTPLEYIELYIQNFKLTPEVKEKVNNRTNLLIEFQANFPINEIQNLTVESYSFGSGSKDSFCYWIERGLEDLGRFFPGPKGTLVYEVFYSKKSEDYISNIKSKTPEERLEDIKAALALLLTNQDYSLISKIFRPSLILKILSSYFPEEYFPVNSKTHLPLIAKILKISYNEIDDIQLNQLINKKFMELKSKYNSEITNFDLMAHLYDKFDIKNNSIELDEFETDLTLGEKKLIQFHPAFTYEDFVRGIVTEVNENNQVKYKTVNKTLAEFAQKALDNQSLNYVLIIDEINRANLPSVLGELIYALEYRYDYEKPNENLVESMYAVKNLSDDIESKVLKLPKNLYIIGTMNTADRSVGHIDYAIRRRFAFVDILPESSPIDDEVTDPETNMKSHELFDKVSRLFIGDDEKKSKYLQADFEPKEVQLGHSYFLAKSTISQKSIDVLDLKLEYEIKPILREYVKDGILSEDAKEIIENL